MRVTVRDALREGRERLAPSRTASLDAQLLLAHALQVPRFWVLAHGEEALEPSALRCYRELIDRRAGGEPVAYLRGFVEWYGYDLAVSPATLVPRPDTEVVLEAALDIARAVGAQTAADVGTGSGAIAVGLARTGGLEVWASDIDPAALLVAERNVARHGLEGRVHLLHGDLLEPLPERPDLIVANLPYLSSDMMTELETDVLHEPHLALYGGPDGLDCYRSLFRQLQKRGWRVPVVFEIDPRTETIARRMVIELMPGVRLTVIPDLAGLARVVVVEP